MPEPDQPAVQEAVLSDYAPWSPDELNQPDSDKQAEFRNIQMSLPVLQEVLDWYDEQIALYSNPEIISGVNPSSKPEDVKNAVLFAQNMISGYKYKRNEFANRFEEYSQAVIEP